MNSSSSFRGRWVGFAVLIGCLIMIAVVGLGEAAGGEGKKSEATAAAKLVEAIVNRNEPPKLATRPKTSWPWTLALFPEGYDWKEDERVRKALDKLYQDTTVELWEEVVPRGSDPSYCATLVQVDYGNARIYTVGDVCSELAWKRLTDVFEQHLPLNRSKDYPTPIYLPLDIKNLADWRIARHDKSLYELQIEVCEKALDELSKVERVSKDEKEAARKKIEAEIKELRRAKKPTLTEYREFNSWLQQFGYDAAKAKKVREVVKSGSSEEIVFGR